MEKCEWTISKCEFTRAITWSVWYVYVYVCVWWRFNGDGKQALMNSFYLIPITLPFISFHKFTGIIVNAYESTSKHIRFNDVICVRICIVIWFTPFEYAMPVLRWLSSNILSVLILALIFSLSLCLYKLQLSKEAGKKIIARDNYPNWCFATQQTVISWAQGVKTEIPHFPPGCVKNVAFECK